MTTVELTPSRACVELLPTRSEEKKELHRFLVKKSVLSFIILLFIFIFYYYNAKWFLGVKVFILKTMKSWVLQFFWYVWYVRFKLVVNQHPERDPGSITGKFPPPLMLSQSPYPRGNFGKILENRVYRVEVY